MSLTDFWRSLCRRWLYVVIGALLGAGAGAALFMSTQPTYQANATVYFSVPMATTGGDLAQGGNYTQQQLASYAELATKPIVLEPVIKSLSLNETPQQLADAIVASVSANTVLTTITVTDSNPRRSAAIANAVADQLGMTVRNLAPKSAQGNPTVDYAIAGHAAVPQFPSHPKKKLDLGAGLLGGLILGIVAALTRDRLDTRVWDEGDLVDLPTVAKIPLDRRGSKRGHSPLISVRSDSSAAMAEAFRQLRTSLQFINVDHPMKIIAITSSLPEEGKSGVSANLSIAFAEAGHRVLLIDADLRRPSIAEYFGIEGVIGLTDVLAGRVDASDVIQDWGESRRLSILASGSVPPNPSELLGSVRMETLLSRFRDSYDIILIDTPPLLPVTDAAVVAVKADGALVIVRHGKTKRAEVAGSVEILGSVAATLAGVVINRVPVKHRGKDYGYYGAVTVGDGPLNPLTSSTEHLEQAQHRGDADTPVAHRGAALPDPERAMGDGEHGLHAVVDTVDQVAYASRR